MANQQLVDYLKTQLAAGAQKPDIHKAAAGAGWPLPEIDAAFAVAEGRPAPTPPPIVAQPIIQPVIQPQEKPLPVIHMHPPGGIFRSGWFWTLIVLTLLVGLGAAAYFLTPIGTMIKNYYAPPPAPIVVEPPPLTNQTYTDPRYGFSVTYPSTLLRLQSVADEVFTLSNFSAAATTSPKLVASCAAPKAATTSVNGIEFTVTSATSTTASTTAQVYSTTHVGACITLKVLDSGANPILQSFRFVATSTPAATSTTVTP